MADYYSPITKMHYSDKEYGKAMEQKYLADKQLKKLEEIKRSNQAQQNIQYDNEGAEIIAEATRQAEKDRYENELELEIRRQKNERDLEDSRQEHEERMQQMNMCEKLGMDYDEIIEFKNILDNWNIEIYKQWKKVYKEMEKFILQVAENSRQKPSYNTSKKINELKEILKGLEEQYEEGKKELEKWIEIENRHRETLNNKSSKSKSSLLMKIFSSTPKENEVNNTYEEGWELTETRQSVRKLENEIKKVKTQIIELENLYDEQTKDRDDTTFWNKKTEFDTKLGELAEKNERHKSVRYGHNEFNEFRKNHYNSDVERLLRRLDFSYYNDISFFGVDETRFDTIQQDEIINNGTVEDYLNFMDNVLNA